MIIIVGIIAFVTGFVFGFISMGIMASSGMASRIEEIRRAKEQNKW